MRALLTAHGVTARQVVLDGTGKQAEKATENKTVNSTIP